MRSSTKRVLKKIFANVMVALLILVYFANGIAGQFSGQINSFLGTSTSMTVTEGDGASAEYVRYY